MMQERGLTLPELEKLRNLALLRSMTFEAAILVEVDEALGWARDSKPELRKAWTLLVPAFDPAQDTWAVRYRALLCA